MGFQVRLFPDAWANPQSELAVAPAPVGVPCAQCTAPIAEGDRGVLMPHMVDAGWEERPWHRRCFLESILGDSVVCIECLDHRRVWVAGNRFEPCKACTP